MGDSGGAVDRRLLRRSSARGATFTFLAQAVKFSLRFGSQLVLARLLLPADFGLVAMVLPLVALVQLLGEFGIAPAIIQRPTLDPGQLSAAFSITIIANTVLMIGFAAAAPLIASMYGEPRAVPLAEALAVLVLMSALYQYPYALLNRQLQFGKLAVVEVVACAAAVTSGLSAAFYGLGYWSLIVMPIAETAIGLLLVCAVTKWRPSWPVFGADVIALFRFGSHATANEVATHVTRQVDKVLIGAVHGRVALGIYDRASNLYAQPVMHLIHPITRIAIPVLARVVHEQHLYRRAFAETIRLAFLVSIPAMLTFALMPETTVRLLLGPNWDPVAPVLRWFCIGSLAAPLQAGMAWLFMSQGRTGEQLRIGILTSAISISSFIAGVSEGPSGVAALWALSTLVISTPVTVWAGTRAGPVGLRDFVLAVRPLVLAGCAVAVLLSFGRVIFPLDTALMFSINLGAAYAGLLVMLLLLPNGSELLHIFAKLRGS